MSTANQNILIFYHQQNKVCINVARVCIKLSSNPIESYINRIESVGTQLRRKRYKQKTEELKASLKIKDKQVVQTEKPKFKPNIKGEKALAPTKVSNVPNVAKVAVNPKPKPKPQQQQQPQPQPLVDLSKIS